MRDRLVTAAGALLALAIVFVLFFRPVADAPVSRPVSSEPGRNGYLAVARWLEEQNVRVLALRERFVQLPELGLAASGNLLITTLPHVHRVRRAEHETLRRWIAAGNTLLVAAAIDDTPEWATAGDQAGFFDALRILTGLQFTPMERPGAPDAEDAARPFAPFWAPVERDTRIELVRAAEHPLMTGAAALAGYSDEMSQLWRGAPAAGEQRLILRLAVERASRFDALWQTTEGEGHVVLVGSGSAFTNHVVAGADAKYFLASLIRHHVGADGAVIFDDMHQGESVLYDPAAFFGDPRLHATLWFLVAAWLAYVLGSSNRLSDPKTAPSVPRQRDFIAAVGGFMARRLDPRAAGMLLLEEWFAEIRRRRGLPESTQPPWEPLRATPTLSPRLYEDLRNLHARLQGGLHVDLVALHNTLREARKAMG